jgi:uncharacterized protein
VNIHSFFRWITEHYRLSTFLSLVLVFAVIGGAGGLSFTPDFRSYFSNDNPQLESFEALEEAFNKRDSLVIIVESKNGSVYQPAQLELIRELTALAWKVPYSRRVDSLANHQRIQATDEGLSVNDLIADENALADSDIHEIEQYASQEPTLLNNLINQSGSASAINITLTLPDNNPGATREVVDWVREQIAPFEQQYADQVELHLFGSAVINLALEEAIEKDLSLLIPISTLLIYILLLLLLRSWSGMLITMTVITLSIAAVFGLFGWFNTVLTPVVGMIPNMVMIIAVADCVHLLVSYYHYLGQSESRQEAVIAALKINFMPMLVTSATTAIGLLCLNFSEAPPYRALGNMAASGAVIAFLLSVTLVPALLCWLPTGKAVANGRGSSALYQPLEKLASAIIQHRRLSLFASVAVIALCAALMTQNKLFERWHIYYDDSFAVRQALDFSDENLNGVNFIQYRIDGNEADAINNPDYLRELSALTEWAAQQPGVTSVDSIVPTLAKVHRQLNVGSADQTPLPTDHARAAQNLLLYNMSLPYGLGTEEYLNQDRSATRISIFLHKTDSRTLLAFDQTLQQWAQQNTPTLNVQEGTGLDMVFAHISDRNMISLLKGTALALVLISLVLIALFKSWRIGLVSLVPNLVPAIVAYGVWGLTVGYVDLGLSIVACMSLGLVVDDTIHFLSKYLHARRELGRTPEQSVHYAFATVGAAMVVTTVVLTVGFAVLMLSPFSPTAGMGGLLSLTIVAALVFDFLLLPPLLLLMDRASSSD